MSRKLSSRSSPNLVAPLRPNLPFRNNINNSPSINNIFSGAGHLASPMLTVSCLKGPSIARAEKQRSFVENQCVAPLVRVATRAPTPARTDAIRLCSLLQIGDALIAKIRFGSDALNLEKPARRAECDALTRRPLRERKRSKIKDFQQKRMRFWNSRRVFIEPDVQLMNASRPINCMKN